MSLFLSHGDFSFPFTWPYYFYKQLFMWSFRTGTPNPDGIIKMPGRLPELVVFMLGGNNLVVSYFFIFSSLALLFAAFYFFAARFLRIQNKAIRCLGALFYTLNPVTLGNLAKTGLIVAAAMLPVSLVAVRYIFMKKKLRYLLLWIICLNISLIHPFTFIVNGAASGGYFLYLAWENKPWLWARRWTFVAFGVIGLLLSAYFLLPMASMRTLSKDIINDSAAASPTDYTAMVEILSTRDLLTGFSLSKDVVIDFAYYGGLYTGIYFAGIIAFYMLLFGVYLLVEKKLSDADRRRVTLSLTAFLALILLATVTVWNVDRLIKFLIKLPGGWAFRSPLKWQLYIPLTLVTMLVILLSYLEIKRTRRLLYGGLIIVFLLMNAYLLAEVGAKLLVPRRVTHFAGLQQKPFNHENILLISNDKCASTDMANRRIRTELKQVLVSKDVQLKQIRPDNVSTINLDSYNYVLDCQNSLRELLKQSYDFQLEDTYADNMFQLYANRQPRTYIYTSRSLFSTPAEQLEHKQAFAQNAFGEPFDFIDDPTEKEAQNPPVTSPIIKLIDPYQKLAPGNIQEKTLTASAGLTAGDRTQVYIRGTNQPLYFRYDPGGRQLSFNAAPQNGYKALPAGNTFQPIPINIPSGEDTISVTYTDSTYTYQNLLPNPSLEEGAWQREVGDCYAVDDKADIGMGTDQSAKSDGNQSLQLWSKNHIACSGPAAVPVKPGNYLLDFDYQSDSGQHAGYALMLNKPNRTILSSRLKGPPKQWLPFTSTFAVPKSSTALRLLVQAYPDTPGVVAGTAHYDNFRLLAVPDVQNRFYFVQRPAAEMQKPSHVAYRVLNPTKSTVHIRGATTPFYLVTKESYSTKWRLALADKAASWLPFSPVRAVAEKNHLRVNGSMNAWYVDPAEVCGQQGRAGCTKNADGSYDMELVSEFTPQRWFYLGLLISGLTFAGCLIYVVFALWGTLQQRGYHFRRP
ncbi:MAG TPA: hypothetical protein VK674_07095 [Candidatus Limnocylindria bacterium]|nr:hypothetical protein [Candidatus Limnocylindria bacterium]